MAYVMVGKVNTNTTTDENNKKAETEELLVWGTSPEKFQGYVTLNGEVTTWLGTELGRISRINSYRNNLGVKITSITVCGANGSVYYGRYGSDGSELCRLTKSKKQL